MTLESNGTMTTVSSPSVMSLMTDPLPPGGSVESDWTRYPHPAMTIDWIRKEVEQGLEEQL